VYVEERVCDTVCMCAQYRATDLAREALTQQESVYVEERVCDTVCMLLLYYVCMCAQYRATDLAREALMRQSNTASLNQSETSQRQPPPHSSSSRTCAKDVETSPHSAHPASRLVCVDMPYAYSIHELRHTHMS